MASISMDPQGNRTIQFVGTDRKRRSIRLARLQLGRTLANTAKAAETIKVKVEALNAAAIGGYSIDRETAEWLGRIGEALYDKLADVGLAPRRAAAEQVTLGAFIDEFIAKRGDAVKPGTRLVWQQARRNLLGYFGEAKPLREVNAGDAEDFRHYLLGAEELVESTARKRCAVASMLFRNAMRHRLVAANPFDDVPKANMATEKHAFINADSACLVLAQLPNAQWRLLFGLSRWGGLRVGSEVRRLEWADIDWERQRFTIRSPKTERYSGHASRVIPIFPELAPLFDQRFAEAADGDKLVLPMLSGRTDTSLRATLERAIKLTGVKPWPRLWHNLRSTRQTELEDRFPSHVVCQWLGNSEATARKHYLQLTDAHFRAACEPAKGALHEAVQSAAGTDRNEPSPKNEPLAVPVNYEGLRGVTKHLDSPYGIQFLRDRRSTRHGERRPRSGRLRVLTTQTKTGRL